jgi:S1-C subfamily serine protease
VTFGRIARLVAAALVVGVAVAAGGIGWQALRESSQRLSAEEKTIALLELRMRSLETRPGNPPTWAAIAAEVEPSVFTIATDQELGSGWVVHADASGSDLLTNFHVVETAWNSGVVTVDVNQADLMIKGTIVRVDPNDDLAVVHVARRLPALETVTGRPALGTAVMAVGSPLGLGGSLSVGVVSGFRSLDGSDYMQFSAPISPGNSGGPVVDGEGRVTALATAKLVADGAEALGLAIPVQTACASLVVCTAAPTPAPASGA